ncbi:MAG: enterochelin esterase [Acidobacteriaceae bacterium]|nr:enterochelin esterase [Acidobacteriaceae bacterium]
MRFTRISACLLLFFCALPVLSQQPPPSRHLFFRVVVGKEFAQPVSGRLLIFLKTGTGAAEVDTSPFRPTEVSVAAKEIQDIAPGEAVEIDTDDIAYPSGFSRLPSGDYQAQAVVDVNHSYDYSGRSPEDPISEVTPLVHFSPAASPEPTLVLTQTAPARTRTKSSDSQSAAAIHTEDFISPVLSRFWGRPIHMRALVVEPPGYGNQPNQHYPAVYFTHGFGARFDYLRANGEMLFRRMNDNKMPRMLWILLDESSPSGTHEFADSANNGPWGRALTTEFIPYLESRYRLDPRPGARFLNGHSSGGWATLWLQVTYPKIFGGTWSTSPDPSDFHDFTGPDLYAPHANVYHRPDGSPYPLVRMNGKPVATLEEFARLESVLGSYGGQLASFEWVFSPRGSDGRPLQMFDRVTGDVHPDVVEAWKKYDISRILSTRWRTLAPDLNGKIHLIVGTADTFYLDGAAHKLKATLDSLHADAEVRFIENRTHFDLYKVGSDSQGLFDQIARQMYQSWQASSRSAHAAPTGPAGKLTPTAP